MSTERVRLLVLVVAYDAEDTLVRVLDRIPPAVLREYDCEVLVIDDASSDRTETLGVEYARAHGDLPLVVLRNPDNQGYGGNQKIGYAYAIERGFDVVALLHGDGQYAPEELARVVEPVRSGAADAVMGSRMLRPGAARRGGMPAYKYVGNRVLSRIQNGLTGAGLSEWHSGYRAYSVPMLARLPFLLNEDGFSFDTEILLQVRHAGGRIAEVPVPTYYGDEVCHVNGVRYAGEVVLASARSALHRRGLVHVRRYDPLDDADAPYELKLGFPSSHEYALAAVPAGASVLDLGAGPGGMAVELVRKGCRVAVVDSRPPKLVPDGVTVHLQDLDDPPEFPATGHDVVLLLDVIEHLRDPEGFLDRLRDAFGESAPRVVLTTPNIAFVAQRLMLGAGRFDYAREGILDLTHTRLFTFGSLRRLLRDAGFREVRMRGVPAPFLKALGDGRLSRALLGLNLALIRVAPRLFSYQIFVEATATPTVRTRLARALRDRRR